MQEDLDLRCNLISVDFKVAQNSYGDMFKVGETVGHEDNDETAVIQSFELDEESNEVKAWTDKGWSHLDFITKLSQDTTEETPVVESWDELQIVDTDGNLKDGGEDDGHYGLCVRRNFLLSNYPNGVIIKPKQ